MIWRASKNVCELRKIESAMVKKLTMIVKKLTSTIKNPHRYQEKTLKTVILEKWARDFEKPPYIKKPHHDQEKL